MARRAATAIDNARLLRQAEEARTAAERSEARLRRLVDANIIGVQVGDGSGQVLYANGAFLRMTGYDQLDVAEGRVHWRALLPPRTPEEKAAAAAEWERTGVIRPHELEVVRKDGTRFPALVGAARFEDESGEGVAFLLDVSERRGLQVQGERLAAIVASSDDAIVGKDLDGIVQSWNRAAERIFGYTEAEMIGQSIMRLIPPELENEEREILARLRRGMHVEPFETVRVRKDGRRLHVSVTISPIRDASGRVVGASKIARDITHQKRLQKELQGRVEALALADRRKDEFLAMLAHELRNPLSPLVTSARIIRKTAGDNPVLARQQGVIERQVRHMSRLLDDLLDVSRITQGKVTLRKEQVDLAQVVSQAIDACRGTIDERGHRLQILLPDEPLPFEADPVRIEQVVCNLVLNAAKYTEPGGRVSVRLVVEAGEARISVRDTGVGISPEFLPSVFDLFSQAERGLDRSQGGLGIGLTLVRSLVELHEGKVEAYSEGAGRGSEFVVRLPLRQTDKGTRV